MLWVLLACRPEAVICLGERSSPFVPVEEEELRATEAELQWEPAEGSEVFEGQVCPEPPCVELRSAGEMSALVSLNREVDNRLRAWVSAEGTSRLELRRERPSGEFDTLVTWELPAGESELDEPFRIEQPGGRTVLVARTEGTLKIDSPRITSTTWAQVEPSGSEPLRLGFLIHVEREENFSKVEASFQRRAVMLEDLAELLQAAGHRLTVQVDDSFLAGARRWERGWFRRMRALNVGWSVHLHGGGSEESFTEVLDASLAAFEEVGIRAVDLNGGFDGSLWATAPDRGVLSLSAYKDAATQSRLAYISTQPWRPPAGSSSLEEFALDDPEGPLIYLPGAPSREEDPARLAPSWGRVLSQALSQAKADRVNSWYFLLHVNDFGPLPTDDFDAWLASGAWEEEKKELSIAIQDALAPYSDRLEPSVPEEMARDYQAWEEHCTFR